MNNYKKAQYFLAKSQALSNAAEFIRSHGEEGFRFEDDAFYKAYRKECENLFNQLDARADVFAQKYTKMGIEIDSEIEEGC